MENENRKKSYVTDKLWDFWCVVSIIGIWPRFVEPNLLSTTRLALPVANLPRELKGLKILQFSDLHFSSSVSDCFLKRLQRKIEKQQPDLIVFTGDFLCFSELTGSDRLKNFLNTLQAPYGCYAIFGNHDYESFVSVNDEGDYDKARDASSSVLKGFKRLFSPSRLTGNVTQAARNLQEHKGLRYLLNETPFELLNNRCKTIKVKGSKLNICGIGEHMLGLCNPGEAYRGYDSSCPGIILAHNPDCIPALVHEKGDVILCGHTHGAQVNLPWIWKKFMLSENIGYKRGLFKLKGKWLYVNRGVGSAMPFRWFSIPELLLLTLE